MSFIQELVLTLPSRTEEISRADEYQLVYLSHDRYYIIPPLSPFTSFGFIMTIDTNIDVR